MIALLFVRMGIQLLDTWSFRPSDDVRPLQEMASQYNWSAVCQMCKCIKFTTRHGSFVH